MRIKVILQNYNITHTKYQELLSAMLKEQRGERMDEEFIRNRITELRLKKGVSEYQMSMELGQNRSYIQAISSGRSMPSMKQFLNICEYFEITPLQFFDAQENNPQLIKKALDGIAHGDQEVKAIVSITHDEEQGSFPVSQSVQFQLIIGRDFTQLCDVEYSKARTTGNQDRLGCFSRDEKSRTFSSNSKRSHILRTSSRSRRLILSSIVSLAVSLKWTRTI